LLDLLKFLFGLHELPPCLLEVLELRASPLYALLDLTASNLEITVEGPEKLGLKLLDRILGTGIRLGHLEFLLLFRQTDLGELYTH
jgi:hypothetical protein